VSEGNVLRARSGAAETTELVAPSVGIFTPTVGEGQLVSAGQSIGTIDVLGVRQPLIVPGGVAGRVIRRANGRRARGPVQYGEALLTLSTVLVAGLPTTASPDQARSEVVLSFIAPMSGRFYSRPSPTEPPFVATGDIVQHGQTIGLLEVMKTFNRLVYRGDSLPNRAMVERVVPSEGDDVVRGDAILMLRPTED
jgi:acetyl-CoA carboxylase biotin carboxyl carrier protein